MNIYYHPLYTYGIDSNSSFPRERYELIRNSLEVEFNSGLINFVEPIKADVIDIYRAHTKDYVDRFLNSKLSDKEIREIGLKPWSIDIINRTLFLTGGSIGALKDLYKGSLVAANLGGGTHHAHRTKGSGFCIFNDLAICAIKALSDYNFKKILIIDLDVHQGDGTATILKNRSDVYTFSMHCEKNFPFKKQYSDLDISLSQNISDEDYIFQLEKSLEKIDEIFKSDLIFFQAGVDILFSDKYGKLSLSHECVEKRNEIIFNFAKKRKNKILIFMGGGYSIPIIETVKSFKKLFTMFSYYKY